jgi:hypothetical protein
MERTFGFILIRKAFSSLKILAWFIIFIVIVSTPALAQVEEEWVAYYDGPAKFNDVAVAIAVDATRNVYVTGYSTGAGTYDDYATIKYDAQGIELWIARYNGPASWTDQAVALSVDSSGNVYVTGYSINISGGWDPDRDYVTVKYDTNGNQLWAARYNGPDNDEDTPVAIVVDASENVYVTGYSKNSASYYDYATVKYDSSGNQLWVTRYDGPKGYNDQATALAVDAGGNVYVTGDSEGDFYATIKYDTNGNELWVARYGVASPSMGGVSPSGLSVDALGNVYVTGTVNLYWGRYSSATTIKYDSNGAELWVAKESGGGLYSGSGAAALAIDSYGNVYITGSITGTETGSGTIKYDTNGNTLWTTYYPDKILFSAIAVDADGNVYVTGSKLTVKYDKEGREVWLFSSIVSAKAMTLDIANNIYVTGVVRETYDNYATAKIVQDISDGGSESDGNGNNGGCFITTISK